MIFIDCEQGTPEWHAARCGVITASKFKDACDTLKTGKPSDKSETYAAQVAMERVSGEPCRETFVNWQMRQGVEREPKARFEYEAQTGNLASESGVVLTDDRLFGYSTDGYVGADGIIEIKCLASAKKVVSMLSSGDTSEYIHQIQGGLWITGRAWCDFVMYVPELAPVGNQLYRKRIERDDNFIDSMVEQLLKFAATVDEYEAILRMQKAA